MPDDRNNKRPAPQQESIRRSAAKPRVSATASASPASAAGRAHTGENSRQPAKKTNASARKNVPDASNAPLRVKRRTVASYIKREIAGIVVMILCVFTCMSIYFDGIAGVMGQAVKNGIMGLVGITAVVVPVILFFVSLGLILDKNTRPNRLKLLTAVLIMWFIATMVSAVTINTGAYVNKNIIQVCTDFCVDGADGIGGGLLGGILALPLIRLFSVPFTMILLIAVSIICIMIITEISAVDTAKMIWYGIKSIGKAVMRLGRRIKGKHKQRAADRAERKRGAEAEYADGFEPDGTTVRRANIGLRMRGDGQTDGRSNAQLSEQAGENTPGISSAYRVPKVGEKESKDEIGLYFSNAEADDDGRLLDLSSIGQRESVSAQSGHAVSQEQGTDSSRAVAVANRPDVTGEASGTVGNAASGTSENPPQNSNADDITFIMKEGPEKPAAERPKINAGFYIKPDINLLTRPSSQKSDVIAAKEEAIAQAQKLEETLKSFGVSAKVVNIARGPAVTRFELTPGQGVKVNKITNLSDDIALNLAASGIRIEAPIPGKSAIGIEIANKHTDNVMLREGLESSAFINHPSTLAVALGKNITGDIVVADLSKMPHLLIAGATGSGKSVCINSLIMSLLYKSTPDKVKLLMIDPKVVELGVYNGIPHLLIPVVTDPKKAAGALGWAVAEMERRYQAFAEKGARELDGYNAILLRRNEPEAVLPRIVIIIDELADLMMVAPTGVEDAICRLAQKARAAGMYLVVATQRPSVDVITGIIKANIPSRIAFSVSSQVDSRTILDMVGAEKLLGKGDMLYYPIGESKPIRIKGAFVSDREVESVVERIRRNHTDEYDEDVLEKIENMDSDGTSDMNDDGGQCDEFLEKAIDMAVDMGQVSVSHLQRKFKIGHSRAGRIVDQMEERGIIGPSEGSKPRQVRISKLEWQEMKLRDSE